MSWSNDPNDNVIDDGGTGDDQWTRDAGNGDTHDTPQGEDEVYTTKTERELAFKMIAAHALVDEEYYNLLKDNPEEAVKQLHFVLDPEDYAYLKGAPTEEGAGVDWDTISEHIDAIRGALNAPTVVRSLW
jgi:hypothetical protein